MKPKLLVVYFGEYRTADNCFHTHKFVTDERFDVSVAFSVWDHHWTENTYKWLPNTSRFYERVTQERVENSFKSHFPDVKLAINLYPISYHTDHETVKSPFWQNLERTLITIDDCESKWGKFDYILLIRPDLLFVRDTGILNKNRIDGINNRNIILSHIVKEFGGMGDFYFLSYPELIKEFIANLTTPNKRKSELWNSLNKRQPYHDRLLMFMNHCGYKPISGLFSFEPEIYRFNGVGASAVGFPNQPMDYTRPRVRLENHLLAFDLDGTIVDTTDLHFEALNQALAEIAGENYVISNEERHLYEGRPTKNKLQILTDNKKLDRHLYERIFDLKQIYTKEKLQHLQRNDRLVELFTTLHENNSIAVVTNCVRETAEIMLEKIGVKHLVHLLVCASDGFRQKPESDMYKYVMEKLGYVRARTIIFEDSDIGWSAAHFSGANVIRVSNPTDIDDRLINIFEHLFPLDITLNPEPKTVRMNVSDLGPQWQTRVREFRWAERNLPKQAEHLVEGNMNILIPMSGLGSRFVAAGYKDPKPLIPVFDKRMIEVVVNNIGPIGNYIYIVQKSHCDKYDLKNFLTQLTPGCIIIDIDYLTEGAADTTLLASGYIDNNIPLLIANSDQFVECSVKDFIESSRNLDGSILTFKSTDPKWSYAKVENDRVVQVAEKNPISDNATVGIYYWKTGKDYVKYARKMINADLRVNNEFYVCPVFNQAIEDGLHIGIKEVDKMWGLGTPEDLEYFINENHSPPWSN